MSDLGIWLVSLARPLVSLLVGIVCFLILRCRPPRSSHGFYFVWLLGSIGWMSATGCLLISGVSGLGDFGNTTRDRLCYQSASEWLWRLLMSRAGLVLVVLISVHAIDPRNAGQGRARIQNALGLP